MVCNNGNCWCVGLARSTALCRGKKGDGMGSQFLSPLLYIIVPGSCIAGSSLLVRARENGSSCSEDTRSVPFKSFWSWLAKDMLQHMCSHCVLRRSGRNCATITPHRALQFSTAPSVDQWVKAIVWLLGVERDPASEKLLLVHLDLKRK